MNAAIKSAPARVIEPHKIFYVRQVLKSIRECRAANTEPSSDDCRSYAHGMISAGLFLRVLTEGEYNRPWDLASNANTYRCRELIHALPLHTWKPTPAVQEACV